MTSSLVSFAPFGEARAFLIPDRIRRRYILVERKFSHEATGLLIQSLAHAGGPYMGAPRDQTLMDGSYRMTESALSWVLGDVCKTLHTPAEVRGRWGVSMYV
jgi:hypothetical protein